MKNANNLREVMIPLTLTLSLLLGVYNCIVVACYIECTISLV